jgi:LSD1 subclass zinc finger protein
VGYTPPVTAAPSTQVRCDNCAALMAWDAAAGKLRCESCGAMREPGGEAGSAVVEHDLREGLARKPRGRLGAGAREVSCGECGAVVELPDGVTATRCSFCDSPQVRPEDAREDHLRPESLVPFAVGREASLAAFRGWLRGVWFQPSDLSAKASVSDLRGVYVPYWAFGAEVTSRWTADAGYHYHETETFTDGSGRTQTRSVRRTRWQPASGWRCDVHEDHLVCASKGLPEKLGRFAADFDLGAGLVPHSPDYLQGFAAESYALDLREAWERARRELERIQEQRCRGDVPGETQRDLRCNHRFADTRFKHVLLPVWIAAFRYHDKVYRFLVNGQTGRVSGEAPRSWLKILLLVLAIAAAVTAIVLLVRR